MSRDRQLRELEESLVDILRVLRLDPTCQWTTHFDRCLSAVRSLQAGGFDQQSLNELSGSVMHVFGGAGSFTDYAPVERIENGRPVIIPGTEGLSELAGLVYEKALELRVVSNAH